MLSKGFKDYIIFQSNFFITLEKKQVNLYLAGAISSGIMVVPEHLQEGRVVGCLWIIVHIHCLCVVSPVEKQITTLYRTFYMKGK